MTGVELCVTGRLDGVIKKGAVTVVEEIKSTRRSLKDLADEPNPIHWAQAKCYAYIWAVREKLDRIDVQLTYVNVDSTKVREIVKRFEMDDLACFFQDLRPSICQVGHFFYSMVIDSRYIHSRP